MEEPVHVLGHGGGAGGDHEADAETNAGGVDDADDDADGGGRRPHRQGVFHAGLDRRPVMVGQLHPLLRIENADHRPGAQAARSMGNSKPSVRYFQTTKAMKSGRVDKGRRETCRLAAPTMMARLMPQNADM